MGNFLIIIWIFIMTFLMAGLNAYGILSLDFPLTHQTGNTTQLAIAIFKDHPKAFILTAIIGLYFLGSFFSGILFHDRILTPRKRYGLALVAGGFLLIISAKFLEPIHQIGVIAFYSGIQNGLFVLYRGVLVRTSHVTGYLTDGAFYLGSYLRGKREHRWKIRFYLGSLGIFLMGALFFSNLLIQGQEDVLSIIGYSYIGTGFFYFMIRQYIRQSRMDLEKMG
ncbi:MAG: YoaK family protein [Tissierellia bacterium]|nr:YoaK family protein [Tissierellia bacterium]